MPYYDYESFSQDVSTAELFLPEVVTSLDEVRCAIKACCAKFGKVPEIPAVGSSNPDRLTCIVDPVSPDNRYPCDFDLSIVWPEKIDPELKKIILANIFPEGHVYEHSDGTVGARAKYKKYPVDVVLASEPELHTAGIYAPIAYSRQVRLSEQEKRTVRELRLFAMRNGLYGGYSRALKGIALEEVACATGGFKESLEFLTREIHSNNDPRVISRITGRNLVERLSWDVKRRIASAADLFLEKGQIKNSPYSIESWQNDHPDAVNVLIQTLNDDPHATYREVRHLTNESMGIFKSRHPPKHAQYVLPNLDYQTVFISVYGLHPQNAKKWYSIFLSSKERITGIQ